MACLVLYHKPWLNSDLMTLGVVYHFVDYLLLSPPKSEMGLRSCCFGQYQNPVVCSLALQVVADERERSVIMTCKPSMTV